MAPLGKAWLPKVSPPPPTSYKEKNNDVKVLISDLEKKNDEDSFSSKVQIMTLRTMDVDRVSEFAWHLFTFASAQDNLMKAPQVPRLGQNWEGKPGVDIVMARNKVIAVTWLKTYLTFGPTSGECDQRNAAAPECIPAVVVVEDIPGGYRQINITVIFGHILPPSLAVLESHPRGDLQALLKSDSGTSGERFKQSYEVQGCGLFRRTWWGQKIGYELVVVTERSQNESATALIQIRDVLGQQAFRALRPTSENEGFGDKNPLVQIRNGIDEWSKECWGIIFSNMLLDNWVNPNTAEFEFELDSDSIRASLRQKIQSGQRISSGLCLAGKGEKRGKTITPLCPGTISSQGLQGLHQASRRICRHSRGRRQISTATGRQQKAGRNGRGSPQISPELRF
ncbi:hypothetical protein C8R43DRAFT_955239 [Mycena crocata]|nr:hypothetical protein C8R43DRAFT_955239 [Mycena crocata]